MLDAIPPARCASGEDQRGEARPFGAGCDIGSIELGTTGLSFNQWINNGDPSRYFDPGEYITITLEVVPLGAGFTEGVITATIPPEFTLREDPILTPPEAGVLGTLPVLAHDIVITANHQLTVTMYAQIGLGIPGETQLFQAFSFTSTQITTPTVITGTPLIRNVPPIARDDHCPSNSPECRDYSTFFFSAFVTGNVLENDTDDNGDTIQFLGLDTTDTRGEVTYHGNGTFRYDPAGQFDDEPFGIIEDTFIYTVTDGNGGQDTAVVTIHVIRGEILVFLPLVIR